MLSQLRICLVGKFFNSPHFISLKSSSSKGFECVPDILSDKNCFPAACVCFKNVVRAASLFLTGHSVDFPGVLVLHDFVSEIDEERIVEAIEEVPWVDSQSGRRKQDYGPKVNFKKKKVKTSVFTGLPKFSKSLIESVRSVDILQDFDIVELCNLEYIPERGAGIDPHKDDEWLWGERLVTLNLLTDIKYTMTFDSSGDKSGNVECHLASRGTARTEELHAVQTDLNVELSELNAQGQLSELKDDSCITHSNQLESGHQPGVLEDHSFQTTDQKLPEVGQPAKPTVIENSSRSEVLNGDEISELSISENTSANIKAEKCKNMSSENFQQDRTKQELSKNSEAQKVATGINLNDIEVEIVLPRRALIVLYGPARMNWKHGIKSKHVKSRRIGITMRELTPRFREGGELENTGSEIFEKAKCFNGLSVAEFEMQTKDALSKITLKCSCLEKETNNNLK